MASQSQACLNRSCVLCGGGGGRKKVPLWIDTDGQCMIMSALFLLCAAHLTYCMSC